MSVTSVGTSESAYSYLRSLLPPPGANTAATDPVSQLLSAFYPSGSADPAAAPAGSSDGTMVGATSSDRSCPPFSPDTMATLISAQGQWGASSVASQAQSLFTQFDTNGDGQISKSEFENVFGSNADASKVDGLFNALDTNGDGSVSEDELTSAAQQSHAHHHHHAHGTGSGSGGGGLADLLSSMDAAGATSNSATNADGSTTTTITYADGSTVSGTVPGSAAADGSTTGSGNMLEQLIRLQAQFLTPSTAQDLAII